MATFNSKFKHILEKRLRVIYKDDYVSGILEKLLKTISGHSGKTELCEMWN